MTLIQGYFFRQLAGPVAAACGALVGIGILSQSLDQLEVVVERGQSLWVMIKLTLLATPQLLAVILPIGVFVGALVALTRLQREQELTAAFAAGVTRWSAIRPAAKLAILAAAATLVINLFVQPWAQREARREAFAIRTDLAALLVEEGRFVQGPEGLTVYVQQVEQNGLMKNLFVYLEDEGEVTTWDASQARFARAGGEPVMILQNGSMQRYSSRGVLEQFSFDRYPFALGEYAEVDERVRFKASDLWLTELLDPPKGYIDQVGSRGELIAEGHARLSSPLHALTAMAMALAAIMGGAFSRTGYAARIAKASGLFLLVRIMGYGLTAACAWNPWLNVLQYLLPIAATAIALRVLFRQLKPRRRKWGQGVLGWGERLKARLA